MAGDIHGYTVLSALSLAGGASVGTLALNGGTLSLATRSISMITGGAQTTVPDGHLALLQAASGFSLVYRSGSTIYTVGASATSAALS